MQDIDWNEFRRKNKNPQRAFEEMAYFLFARSTKQPDGIFAYQNQAGIETVPVSYGGKHIGFQAKFFDTNQIDWAVIKKGIANAKSKNPKLNEIRYYANAAPTESSLPSVQKTKPQIDAEKLAKDLKVKLDWVSPSQLKALLNSPEHLDLAQLYFGLGDEFGFVKSAIVPEIQTLLVSGEYLPLPIERSGASVANPSRSILQSRQKSFLLLGHPGCGKTTYIHALFREFGGLNKQKESDMLSVLRRNNAVPMLVNLKNCTNESLESVIRERQNDSRVRGRTLQFIYLLDGLDELSEERADLVLSEIKDLELKDSTKKIIISCRSGNLNRLKVGVYLSQINEFCFSLLDHAFIQRYFEVKGDRKKIRALTKLSKSNSQLILDSRDILLVSLLWDTIESLHEKSTVADLMEKKIKLLLKDVRYKKNIDSLNLLDFKSDAIIELNKEISFEFQKKYQYRFSREELQEIFLRELPRIDYRSINEVLNYVATIFFEDSDPGTGPGSGYIYLHRRYQEFFFAQKLKEEYEKDPMILRHLDVLSGRDFFESFFLPYLRGKYENNKNIVGLLDINLLDVYLGNHRGYGVDDTYYLNSRDFIPALASQNDFLVEELLESGDFKLKNALFTDLNYLRKQFVSWQDNKSDFRLNDYLSAVWGSRIASLLDTAVEFWNAGKKDTTQALIENIRGIRELYREFAYFDNVENDRSPDDPYWKAWQSYLFILIRVNRKSPLRILNEVVRPMAPQFDNANNFPSIGEEGLEKLYSAFFRAALKNLNGLVSDIPNFSDAEMINLLRVLSTLEGLAVLNSNPRLKSQISNALNNRIFEITEDTVYIPFLKKYLGIPISSEDVTVLESLLITFRDKHKAEWHYRNIPMKFAETAFALGKYDFAGEELSPDDHIRFYSEQALYTALFTDLIAMIDGKTNIHQIARKFINYWESHDERTYGGYLKVDISFLWAEIFSVAEKGEIKALKMLKRKIINQDYGIILYSFCYKLAQINKSLFNKLITETELDTLGSAVSKADDFQSLVDECLVLSLFYSDLDEKKSRNYFIRAMKESLLRHGWRKDTIVSYRLVEALKILWRNNWVTDEELNKYADEVFKLTIRVSEFTDGAGTSNGPYNVIELVADYDVALAEQFREYLQEVKGSRNLWSIANVSITLGKVALGLPFEAIESDLVRFQRDYDYDSKPRPDSFERKIEIYVAIAESDLYTDAEREDAFNKAHSLVEEMKNEGITYYLRDIDFADLKTSYMSLCKKYGMDINVDPPEEKGRTVTESDLVVVREINRMRTKAQVRGFYRRVSNYNNHVVIKEYSTWELLIEKTYKILGNIQPLIKWLEDSSYPHTDWFTENSKYFHIPLGISIKNVDTHQEIVEYLYKNTGHDGFINMIKAYEVIGDREMCRKLFIRFLQLCHLLSESE